MLILMFIVCVKSLTTTVDSSSEFCMHFPTGDYKTLEVEFVVAGYQEGNNRVWIIDPYGDSILDETGLIEFSEEYIVEEKGYYALCIQTFDTYVKVFTFELYFSSPELDDALRSDFAEIEQEYETLNTQMMQIYRNQRFLIDREKEQNQFLVSLRKILKNAFQFRAAGIIFILLIQLCFIREYVKYEKISNVKVRFHNEQE